MQSILLFLGGIGGWEVVVILVFILIFFGANKIPEMARGLGKGIREFKDATREIQQEIQQEVSKKEEKHPEAQVPQK